MGTVTMLYLAGIILLALLSPTYGNPLNRCYSLSTYDQSLVFRNISGVWDPTACQGHCYDDQGCVAFTHHNAGDLANLCSLFSNTSAPVSCNYMCMSGPKECDMCSDHDTTCTQGLLDIATNITTETYCQLICYAVPECSTYTWFTPNHPNNSRECHLFSSCDNTTPCEQCLTGPDDCAKCFPPENVENGVWDCSIHDVCYLRCDPGFVAITPDNRPNYCAGGIWIHPPESVSCAPGVALLYGGAGITTTEAYSSTSTCSVKLPDHEHTLTGHSMEYIGVPVMCGGRIGFEIASSNKCWVLEDNQAGVMEWREYKHSLQQHRNSILLKSLTFPLVNGRLLEISLNQEELMLLPWYQQNNSVVMRKQLQTQQSWNHLCLSCYLPAFCSDSATSKKIHSSKNMSIV